MKRTSLYSLLKGNFSRSFLEENDCEKPQEVEGMRERGIESRGWGNEIDDRAQNVQCMTLLRGVPSRRDLSRRKYGMWRQAQKTRVARLEKQLKVKSHFEELIGRQLEKYHAHYNLAMVPTRLKDVPQFFNPEWAPPYELTTLSWLGDWRPSAILDLLRVLIRTSSTSFVSESNSIERLLSQLIDEIRIEEAVIDGAMFETQATCIFHLPFTRVKICQSGNIALSSVHAEFKKIARNITKAHQLRFKALELAVKKVLNKMDAAEFLVAFMGIQDLIHQFAVKQKLPKGPVIVPVNAQNQSVMGNSF
ncbi:hypothetical protein K2173_019281 [Erythroxylum novogranatense]|uniref:DOG1 domain-containing protein n=1 Tax=Erythroxylum novogranatense TaxID=1862640 RepID=A0AAV8STV5_9ROSI|nr:hypothetical protein K2173_019281 [Erythroxylum novogranatense]